MIHVIPKASGARTFFSARVALRDLAFFNEQASYFYMMSSSSRRALYAGVTARFRSRVFEHKNDLFEGFPSKYKCHRFIYFERFERVVDAIAREKEVKVWRREKKDKLVESMNPTWKDLAADWYPETLLFQGKPVKPPS